MLVTINPKLLFLKNEGILSAKPGGISIVKRVKQAFERIGFEITDSLRENALFDTSYFNVPQKEKEL